MRKLKIRVTQSNLENIIFEPADEATEITQNITVLASTPRGSVPLERELGIRTDYIDLPINRAVLLFHNNITSAVDRWEDRARVLSTDGELEPVFGRMIPTVEVEIK